VLIQRVLFCSCASSPIESWRRLLEVGEEEVGELERWDRDEMGSDPRLPCSFWRRLSGEVLECWLLWNMKLGRSIQSIKSRSITNWSDDQSTIIYYQSWSLNPNISPKPSSNLLLPHPSVLEPVTDLKIVHLTNMGQMFLLLVAWILVHREGDS